MGYISLHTHTDASFLDSLNRPKELVKKAKELGMSALCTTDHGNVYNYIKLLKECQKQGIKYIPGIEFYFTAKHGDKERKSRHITIIAYNNEGLRTIYKLTTLANYPVDKGGGFYYRPRIDWEMLEKDNGGLICLTGCFNSPINHEFGKNDYNTGKDVAEHFLKIFGRDRLFVELQNVNEKDIKYFPEQEIILDLDRKLAKDLGLKSVSTNDCHYINKDDAFAHEILKAIDGKATLKTPKAVPEKGIPGRIIYAGYDYYMRNTEEMKKKFTEEEVEQSQKIADMCDVNFQLKQNKMPKLPGVSSAEAMEMLKKEARKGWINFGINKLPNWAEYKARMQMELKDIEEAGLQDYLIIVWDVVNFCLKNKIPVNRGRGSAAGSLTCYLLEITAVDPIEHGLIWERFWNRGRKGSMPDIDVDICISRRDEVIKYLREKFGEDKVFQMMAFSTMATKAVIKDIGKVLCLPFNYVNKLTDHVPHKCKSVDDAIKRSKTIKDASNGIDSDIIKWTEELKVEKDPGKKKEIETKIAERTKTLKTLFRETKKLENVARQRTGHPCALLIADEPVFGNIPLCWDAGNKRLLTAFDMYDIEELGYLKLDVLGLKTLDVCAEIDPEIVRKHKDFTDKKVFDLISEGKTKGVFQLESGLGKSWCKKIKPRTINELSDLNALLRPAVLEIGMTTEYMKNREDPGRIRYIHPDLKPILKDTYSIMTYQEQMLKIVEKFSGFDLSKCDLLRKACIAKNSLILTNSGPRKIEVVAKNFNKKTTNYKILTCNESGELEYRKLQNVWKVGEKEVYKIKTINGFEIELTGDHEVFTNEGYKSVSRLTDKNSVVLPNIYSYKGYCKNINIDRAILLSYFIGEGCYTLKSEPKITNSNPWIINKIKNVLIKEFGNNSFKETIHPLTKCSDIFFKNAAKIWIKSIYKKCKSRKKYIPKLIYNSTNGITTAFIGSYFSGEGSVEGCKISFSTTSKQIAKILQMLLLRDGIHASYNIKQSKYKNKPYISYRITLSERQELAKFYKIYQAYICPTKIKCLEDLLKCDYKSQFKSFTVPSNFIKSIASVNNLNLLLNKGECSESIYKNNITYDKAQYLNNNIGSNLLQEVLDAEYKFVKIRHINKVGKKEVYDFSVDSDYKWGFINGILVHNCGKKLPEQMATYEKEFITGCIKNNYSKEIAQELWKWINATAGYSFNKSHSMSYAQLAYITAWLKLYHTPEFFLAMLKFSSQEQKPQEEIKELFYDSKLFGVDIKPPSVDRCNIEFELHKNTIYFGLKFIKNIGKKSYSKIKKIQNKNWDPILKDRKELKLDIDILEALIKSGALDSLGLTRKAMAEELQFYNSLTDNEIEVFRHILYGMPKSLIKETKKESFNFVIPKATSFKKAVLSMIEFIDGKNKEMKLINSRRSETLKVLCNSFIDTYDDGREYSNQEKAELEKKYLGMPITCSITDSYYHREATHKLIQAENEVDRGYFSTIVLINSVKTTIDKNGKEMAYINIEDKTFCTDSVMFAKAYSKYGKILKPGQVVLFRGLKGKSLIINKMELLQCRKGYTNQR